MLQINVHVESYSNHMIYKTLENFLFNFLLVYKWMFGMFGNIFIWWEQVVAWMQSLMK
jgi:hypothetical protein